MANRNAPATPTVIDLTAPETIDLTGDDDPKPQQNELEAGIKALLLASRQPRWRQGRQQQQGAEEREDPLAVSGGLRSC